MHNINLSIQAGQVVALVGPSGAGKSTLFSLLLRFNTAQSGGIELDGINLSQVKARELRKQVAIVPQRTTVFSGSIAEAILFGREASHQQLIEAAHLANAHDFIMALPDGYDTQLEERGTNVSGGQLQRLPSQGLCWATLLFCCLMKPPVPWMPKPRRPFNGLRQAMQGRTVLSLLIDLPRCKKLI